MGGKVGIFGPDLKKTGADQTFFQFAPCIIFFVGIIDLEDSEIHISQGFRRIIEFFVIFCSLVLACFHSKFKRFLRFPYVVG